MNYGEKMNFSRIPITYKLTIINLIFILFCFVFLTHIGIEINFLNINFTEIKNKINEINNVFITLISIALPLLILIIEYFGKDETYLLELTIKSSEIKPIIILSITILLISSLGSFLINIIENVSYNFVLLYLLYVFSFLFLICILLIRIIFQIDENIKNKNIINKIIGIINEEIYYIKDKNNDIVPHQEIKEQNLHEMKIALIGYHLVYTPELKRNLSLLIEEIIEYFHSSNFFINNFDKMEILLTQYLDIGLKYRKIIPRNSEQIEINDIYYKYILEIASKIIDINPKNESQLKNQKQLIKIIYDFSIVDMQSKYYYLINTTIITKIFVKIVELKEYKFIYFSDWWKIVEDIFYFEKEKNIRESARHINEIDELKTSNYLMDNYIKKRVKKLKQN